MNDTEAGTAGVALAAGRMVLALRQNADSIPEVLEDEHPLTEPEAERVALAIEKALDSARQVMGTQSVRPPRLGVSVGGHVCEGGCHVRFAPDVIVPGKKWSNEPLAETIRNTVGVPAVLENDVNCMTEFQRQFGQGAGVSDFIVVYLAPDVQGLGCGIVTRGELVRGASGGAGEFGHIVIQPEGPRCRCGKRGCLEAMLVVDNFDRDLNWGAQTYGQGFANGAGLVAQGLPRAHRVFERSGRHLGQGLATAVNLLNPRKIILGGPSELVAVDPEPQSSASFFMKEMRESLSNNSFSSLGKECDVVVEPLDLQMAARGAALLAAAPGAAACEAAG